MKTRLIPLVATVLLALGGSLVPISAAEAATCTQVQLRRGSVGTCVRNLQTMLNGIAYYYGGLYNGGGGCGDPYLDRGYVAVDGSFGPGTSDRVYTYQRWQCISADRVVGPVTWSRLCADATFHGPSPSEPVMRDGYYAALRSGCPDRSRS
ncbi:peptidoglycan-binding protein [Nocardioides sp. HDW12B]|uniref:peptidoglycan-binding domain-containing protein n=1 Tax=Nocardioides sp. HDW12B TaxID=2714939 RepID=UPI001409DCE0|nr:peptidoglycan-binding domain-containing protein [Nocardioides sp. HDW12B]QIK67898.1 peptidoglycan-binding protein [Nocardioides sp. HDW12B]